MELFDASGIDDKSGAAAGLANALMELSRPLNEISNYTNLTAANTESLKRSNPFSGRSSVDASDAATKSTSGTKTADATIIGLLQHISNSSQTVANSLGGRSIPNRMATVTGSSPASNRMATVIGTQPGPQNAALFKGFANALANSGQSKLGGIGEALSGASSMASNGIGRLFAGISSAAGPVGIALGAIPEVAIQVTKVFGVLAASITGTIVVARAFAQAFDPSTVMAFDAALQDLRAVIGMMMTPIVTEATKVVRYFSNALYGGAEGIMKSVRVIAKSFGDMFVAMMPIVVQVTQLFSELLAEIADWTRAFADSMLPTIRGVVTILAGFGDTFKAVIKSLFPASDLKSAMVQFAQSIARINVIMTAFIFKLMGMNESIGAMLSSLRPGADKRGMLDAAGLAAAQNARMASIQSIGQEMLQRALMTSGQAGQMSEDVSDAEFRNRLIRDIEGIKAFDFKAFLVEVISTAFGIAMAGPHATKKKAEQDKPVPLTKGDGIL